MEKIREILEDKRPSEWKEIPDIDLYMDQVLGYMERQHPGLQLEENLTAAMVNNYIKKDLLPRATGKKYNRQHVAFLTAICLLKQILSVDETGKMMEKQVEERNDQQVSAFYEKYLGILDTEFNKVSKEITQSEESPEDIALRLAVSSYAQKLACQEILKKL